MSVFNRVIIILVALLILAAAVIVLLVSAGICSPDVLPFEWSKSALGWVAGTSGARMVSVIAISAIIAVIMIGLLAVEVAPPRKPAPLLISSSIEGITTVDVASICMLVEHVAVTVHGVRDVKSIVEESPVGLLIECQTTANLGSSILEIEPELRSRVKAAIEQLTGLPVAQVDVKIKYDSGRSKRLAVS
ncbi:MAG: alkaline shock response membrane anchor protein AmaP [Dehalococcoidia bacterium]|nr:alkaline shock response membrane anchor protein AmaP [Dehalococcoidia bacterium]